MPILIIYLFIIGPIFAVIGSRMARARNRDAMVWALICYLFTLLGIFILSNSEKSNGNSNTVSGASLTNDAKIKWKMLKELDPEIRQAAERVRQYGQVYENLLAQKYMALNDKAYLVAAEDSVNNQVEIDENSAELNQRVAAVNNSKNVLDGAFGRVALLTFGGLVAIGFFFVSPVIFGIKSLLLYNLIWLMVLQSIFVAWIGTNNNPAAVLKQVICGSMVYAIIGSSMFSVMTKEKYEFFFEYFTPFFIFSLLSSVAFVAALFLGNRIAKAASGRRS